MKIFVGIAAMCLMASFATPSLAHDDTAEIKSKAITGEVPLDPNSDVWNDAKYLIVGMGPQNLVAPGLAKGTVSSVKVKSVHNGKDIAFLLEWYDPTEDDTETMMNKFSDAVAMMFPVKPGTEPTYMMGDPDNPVEIIYWKAAWQKDIDKGYQDVRDAYPNYNYDTYPMLNNMIDARGNPIEVKDGEIYKPVAPEDRAINTPIGKYTDAQKGYLPGLAVNNPRSRIDRTKPVEELNAIGFGTLTTEAVEGHANGKGIRSFGYWKIVLTHPLKGEVQDASFIGNNGHFMTAIAVWDGDKGNRGGRKNFSNGGWIPLWLEP
ncbi:MAG: hypothetical protein KGK17_09795 [Betaproteobacteria bacterium]|nr:hypothetical protein [Betaproteobacteria bacterium]